MADTIYRPEIYVMDGSPEVWYSNAIRGTAEEAEASARKTYRSWTLAGGWRVVPDSTPKKQPIRDEHLNQVFLEEPTDRECGPDESCAEGVEPCQVCTSRRIEVAQEARHEMRGRE